MRKTSMLLALAYLLAFSAQAQTASGAGNGRKPTIVWSSSKCEACDSTLDGHITDTSGTGLFTELISTNGGMVAAGIVRVYSNFMVTLALQTDGNTIDRLEQIGNSMRIEVETGEKTVLLPVDAPDPRVSKAWRHWETKRAGRYIAKKGAGMGFFFFPYDNDAYELTVIVELPSVTLEFPFSRTPTDMWFGDPAAVHAASVPSAIDNDQPPADACDHLLELRIIAFAKAQWQDLVDNSRQYVSACSNIVSNKDQALALFDVGTGLDALNRPGDAIPVLRRCVTLEPHSSPCWAELGKASLALGNVSDAKAFFEKTVEIGGFDQLSATVVRYAKAELAIIQQGVPDQSGPVRNDGNSNADEHSFGTGFFVSRDGYLLTANHVVSECRALATSGGRPLRLVSTNIGSDLALLKAGYTPSSVAVFRTGPSPKLGDSVVAFGFPLPGILSSQGNVSTGVISATSGIQNDSRFIQISAPIQPGNSGGPLFDSSGHVIGVVVSKLDALKIARYTGDIPENVNFAVHWAEVNAFLDEAGIGYEKAFSGRDIGTRAIAAAATEESVEIDCTK